MSRGEQIDKVSKELVKINAKEKRFAKWRHKRYLRKIRKDINKQNPQHNRYDGYIG